MKGIILSGGSGTRLQPITSFINKHLIPIYDRPMLFFPLTKLIELGIREILIISDENNIKKLKKFFNNGEKFGLKLFYKIQKKPNGLPEAFTLGKNFIGNSDVALILGDNIFLNDNIDIIFEKNLEAKIFIYRLKSPSNSFGTCLFNENGKIIKLVEKPQYSISNHIIAGIYFYRNSVIRNTSKLKFSSRNELEITDLNNVYLNQNSLGYQILNRKTKWFDAGNSNSILNIYKYLSKNNKILSGYLEITCLKKGLISKKNFNQLISKYSEESLYRINSKLLYEEYKSTF